MGSHHAPPPIVAADRGDRLGRELAELLPDDVLERYNGTIGAPDRADSIATLEELASRLGPDASPELRAVVAGSLLREQLRGGLDRDALDGWSATDPVVRDRALSMPRLCLRAEYHKYDALLLAHDPASVAGDLLAVAPTGADAAGWRKALAAAADAPEDDWCIDRLAEASEVRACLALVEDPAPDGFALRFGADPQDFFDDCAAVLTGRTVQRRMIAAEQAAGVPSAWIRAPGRNAPGEGVWWSGQAPRARWLAAHPEAKRRVDALRTALAQVDAADPVLLDALGDEGPGVATTPSPSAADRALATAMRARLAASTVTWPTGPLATSPRPPACPRRVLACATEGADAWQVVVSADFDPTGEVPVAGFWVRREGPAGVADLYLGLQDHRPWVILRDAEMTVVDGELRIPVQRQALITDSITFPPVGLEFEDPGPREVLRVPIAGLTRDADGDQLTDVAERHLLLDPANPDTDADGLPDGTDPLPNVPMTTAGAADARANALAAGLAVMADAPDQALSVMVPGSAALGERRQLPGRTLFLRTDPADLVGLAAPTRILVLPWSLTEEELDRQAAYEMLLPTDLVFAWVTEGKAAVLDWDSHWAGGQIAVWLQEGVWHAAMLGGWIS